MMGLGDMMSGGWGMWVIYLSMTAFWVAAVAVVLWAMRSVSRVVSREGWPPPAERAIEVLERRYAAGEIDAIEFRRMKSDLSEPGVAVAPGLRGAGLHLVTQTRSTRDALDWGPRPVA
jgi:uncharacterized membrane protein